MEKRDLLPDGSNFFAMLTTALSKEELAQLYDTHGYVVTKCSLADFEVRCLWAELVLESENPVLLHGPVVAIEVNRNAF